MTYRERREARAERLREYAAKRESSAAAVHQSQEHHRGDHAYNFQPANPNSSLARLRRRENARTERAFESEGMARDMSSRAEEIDRQADRSIYSDDPDAVEKLEAKIAGLEAKREQVKQARAKYRREHKAELAAMASAYERDQALPFPAYVGQNLSGQISQNKQRLARLKREAAHGPTDRIITARFASSCESCGAELAKGTAIRYNRAEGARCLTCEES